MHPTIAMHPRSVEAVYIQSHIAKQSYIYSWKIDVPPPDTLSGFTYAKGPGRVRSAAHISYDCLLTRNVEGKTPGS